MQTEELCRYLKTDQNKLHLRVIGIDKHYTYLGLLSQSNGFLYLHVFCFDIHHLSFETNSIKLSNSQYKVYPTNIQLKAIQPINYLVGICQEQKKNKESIFLYQLEENNWSFYRIQNNKTNIFEIPSYFNVNWILTLNRYGCFGYVEHELEKLVLTAMYFNVIIFKEIFFLN